MFIFILYAFTINSTLTKKEEEKKLTSFTDLFFINLYAQSTSCSFNPNNARIARLYTDDINFLRGKSALFFRNPTIKSYSFAYGRKLFISSMSNCMSASVKNIKSNDAY